MRDRMQLQVAGFGRAVVQHQHGAVPAREEMLQRQDLAAIAQRVLRQQAQFRQAVQHHAHRVGPVHQIEDAAHRLSQLHLAGMQKRLFVVDAELVLGDHLEDVDAVQRQVMRPRDGPQLGLGLGQGDVEAAVTRLAPLHQELQRQRGLS